MPSPKRLAQVHLMRTAGTFVSAYLNHALFPSHLVQISWFQGLKRDWTRAEMDAFGKTPGPMFVHNHVVSWDEALVERFQEMEFFVFAFVRNVGDQLCSLYHFAKRGGADTSTVSLDEFLRQQMRGETCFDVSFRDWAIPDYWRKLDWVRIFSITEIEQFVTKVLDLSWDTNSPWLRRINASDNQGYKFYCETGEISPNTQQLITKSIYQERYWEVAQETIKPGGKAS